MMVDDREEDAEARQQRTFQEFMMRGKRGNNDKTDSVEKQLFAPQTARTPSSSKKKKQHHQRKNKRTMVVGFRSRLKDWKDTDDQSLAVIESIAHLRDRLQWESVLLLEQEEPDAVNDNQPPWRDCGFRGVASGSNATSRCVLLRSDIEEALSADLLQHEKMLAGLRTLISSLAQELYVVGRRLDEWMLFSIAEAEEEEWNQQDGDDSDREEDQGNVLSLSEEKAQDVYRWLAQELHRKQCLVQNMLDSCHDGILDKDSPRNLQAGGDPRKVASTIAKEWLDRNNAEWITVQEFLSEA